MHPAVNDRIATIVRGGSVAIANLMPRYVDPQMR
jgi:hypothetical protein